jgi:hypothetical protein
MGMFELIYLSLFTYISFVKQFRRFFLWWPGFEPPTLHVLCIVPPTKLSSRGHNLEEFMKTTYDNFHKFYF